MIDYADNLKLKLAYRLAEHTSANIFLTGKAGTGKTTFLRNLVKQSKKNIIVAAPTGIAAINAHGQTLHSLLQLDFGPFIPGAKRPGGQFAKFHKRKLAIIRAIDMLVIDEISMVRADLLDYVDDMLRRLRYSSKPFGGVQMLLIGDLQQLPPVVKENEWQLLREHYASPYFFHSKALAQSGYISLELDKVYRQSDHDFVNLLNQIRNRHDLPLALSALNQRYIPSFTPPAGSPWIQLTTHNAAARNINLERLEKLPGSLHTFEASITGNFPESAYPAEQMLSLKEGAQVMFVKNDQSPEKRFYNGMIGTIKSIEEQTVTVSVPEHGDIIATPQIWENARYDVDNATKEIKQVVDGTFSQLPLRTAWAITIHKSQGLTFEHAMIDASAAFAHGQAYVALSRCKNLEGLVLTAPLPQHSIITDPMVDNFLQQGRLSTPDEATISLLEREFMAQLLDSVFLTDSLDRILETLHRTVADAFSTTYPKLLQLYSFESKALTDCIKVSKNFAMQYRSMLASDMPLNENPVQERIKAGASYFHKRFFALKELLTRTPQEHDNQKFKEALERHRAPLEKEIDLRLELVKYLEKEPFATAPFMEKKAQTIIELESPAKKTRAKKPREKKEESKLKPSKQQVSSAPVLSDDILHPDVYNALVKWRREKSAELGQPAFTIMHTKAIISIANSLPRTIPELMNCDGIGKILAQRVGPEVLEIISGYDNRNK